MTGIYFPAGSRIGSFSVETFVFQGNGAVTYLVRDTGAEKFFLTIPGEELTGEVLKDIEIFSGVQDPAIIPPVKVECSPLPYIVTPCVDGLSLDDCRVAEKNFTAAEAEHIINSLITAVEKLCAAGCQGAQITMQNVIIDKAGNVRIFRSCGKYGESNANALRRVLKEVCILSEMNDPRMKQLRKRLESLPESCSVADVSNAAVFSAEEQAPASAPQNRKILFVFLAAVFVLAVSAAGTVLFLRRAQSGPEPEQTVTVAEIKASYRSAGPVIHELESGGEKKAVEKLQIPAVKAVRKVREKKVEKPRVKAVVKKPLPVPEKRKSAVIAAAAKRGNLMEIRNLISAGNDVNLKDREGRSALYYAAAANWKAMIDLLVKAGAKITADEINAGKPNTARYLQRLCTMGNRPRTNRNVPRRNVVQRPPHTAVRPIPNTSGWRKAPRKNWHITLESAARNALRQKRKIFVLFTGADWCGPCKALKKNALDTAEFRRLTRNVEIVYLDFPRASDRKFPIQQRNYNIRIRSELRGGGGVPQVLILDWRGNRIGAIGGFGRKEAFFNRLKPLLKR